MIPYRRYAPLERLEDTSDAPESEEDSICPECHQLFWFCQGHPKTEAIK